MAFGVKNFPTSLDDLLTLLPARDTAATQLTAALASGATSMSVADTSRFPAAGVLTFKGEHIGYTGKTSTSFTGLTRANFTADGGATAQTGAIGDPVRLAVTARHHNVLAEALIAVMTKLGTANSTPANGTILVGTGAGQSQWIPGGYVDTGAVMMYPIASIPGGWLECNGQAVSRTTYQTLFNVIGTVYGAGDGSTTFNVPDTRGKAIFGYHSGNTKFDVVGETGGAETVQLTGAQSGLPGHLHAVNITSAGRSAAHYHQGTEYYNTGTIANQNTGGQTDWNTQTTRTLTTGNESVDHTHAVVGNTGSVAAADAAEAHPNLPPYLTWKFIIRT